MAKKIEATPTLSGKDAECFAKRLKKTPTKEKREFLDKARSVYKTIQSNQKKVIHQ